MSSIPSISEHIDDSKTLNSNLTNDLALVFSLVQKVWGAQNRPLVCGRSSPSPTRGEFLLDGLIKTDIN